MKRLLDHTPETGVTEWFVDSDDGKSFSIVTEQDAQPHIEMNKKLQGMGREYYAQDNDMWRVASIPIGIVMKWLVEDGIDVYNPEHSAAVTKKLNDPEWKYLKRAEITL